MPDVNFESHAQEDSVIVQDRVISPDNPSQYSDVLKFSQCTNSLVTNCDITSGHEDAIDMVRGDNYQISNTTLRLHGTGGIEIQGSIEGVLLSGIKCDGHGTQYDIRLGMFSNYDHPGSAPTKSVTIVNCSSFDGKPVNVEVWNADLPIVHGGNVKVKVIPKPIVTIYFAFRYIWIKLFGVP